MFKNLGEGFGPRMLIEAARHQATEFPWLPAALSKCGEGEWESRAYVRYVPCHQPNQPGSEWQFETNVVLHLPELGMVVLDVLQGQRIGGIELVDRIEG